MSKVRYQGRMLKIKAGNNEGGKAKSVHPGFSLVPEDDTMLL